MSYAEYGLDETKKSKDDDVKPSGWLCLWCAQHVKTGLGLCFSNWAICYRCVAEANYPYIENESRWHDGVDCFKCKKEPVRGYRQHDSFAIPLYICGDCIEWGHELATGKISTEEFKNNNMPTLKASEAAIQVLKKCKVEENVVKLPPEQLDRNLYQEVRKHLELIGGKWVGRSIQGFQFKDMNAEQIQELLSAQANGEGRNLKKEYQFFATPEELAQRMMTYIKMRPGMKVLEPGAGDGALITSFHTYHGSKYEVDYCELMDINRVKLARLKGCRHIADDFLKADIENEYDYIIANPPFSNNQDIDHIRAMYKALKTNGRLITIASVSWKLGNRMKQIEFRGWLQKVDAFQDELPAGTFKASGTNVPAMLLVIDKLEESALSDLAIIEGSKLFAPEGIQSYTKEDYNDIFEEQVHSWGNPMIGDATTIGHIMNEKTKTNKDNMKKIIVIPTSPFVAVLKKVKEVVDKNPTMALLDNILIKVRRTDIQVIATDLIVTVIANIDITNDGENGYEFLLPFKFLHDYMVLVTDNSVTIELQERTKKEEGKKVTVLKAVLTTFSDTVDVDWLDSTQDWPNLPEFPQENSIGIADGFIEWLNLMLTTVSDDKLRPSMQKIYIGIANNGVTMASTNAHVVVEKTFQCESPKCVDMLINPKIAKALKGFKETTISWSDTHIAFVSSNMTLIGTIQDEKFPNYRAVFPDSEKNLTVSLNELTNVIQKMMLTQKNADIWLKREIGHIVVESIDTDHNRKPTIRIGADYTGDCDKVTIVPKEMLNLIEQVKYVNLSFSITEPTKPILITTESDPTYRSLIMPQLA